LIQEPHLESKSTKESTEFNTLLTIHQKRFVWIYIFHKKFSYCRGTTRWAISRNLV